MELYSKEELLKELKKEYSCGGECDHCPEVLDAGSCAFLMANKYPYSDGCENFEKGGAE